MKSSLRDKILFNSNNYLNLRLIKDFWPSVISYKKVKIKNINKIDAILKTRERKNLFLKIRQIEWLNNKNNLLILHFLKDKINTPNLLDYKVCQDNKGKKRLWLLYEYIKPDEKIGLKNFKIVARELVKFHNLDLKNNPLDFQYFLRKNIGRELGKIDRRIPILLRKKNILALRYFVKKNNSPKGLCHFDLDLKNFIINNNRAYILDFEMTKYDYVIFDLAIFINQLIINKKSKLVIPLIKYYYQLNKKIKYNKQLLYCSQLLMINYMYNQNLTTLRDLLAVARHIEILYKSKNF